ncbi:MAG: UDP-N-acetylglucosamine 1-carboxyvinyltransferase [Candidatus Cloacimonetes bacterium 4572_55]|nr:MAG: UDP-N-acetylglucosamine 1-carboxyvinyltransferase [Candidatus Cloacimonetes bacterium 4572_55]
MEKFIIEGGRRIQGEIEPRGSKNEALAILSATAMLPEKTTISNIPLINDVLLMIELLKAVGVSVERLDKRTFTFQADGIKEVNLCSEAFRKIRGSLMLLGPLLGRIGKLKFPLPGGDKIGRRRIDTHVYALEKLGAQFEWDKENLVSAPDGLSGADILLDEASVTATENAIMAAVQAVGTTTIYHAACEPHVQQLCHFLNQLGARIEGIGSNLLTIHGGNRLSGGHYRITSDYLEVGGFVGLAALTRGELLIRQAAVPHLFQIRRVFSRLGIRTEIRGDDLFVPSDQSLEITGDLGGNILKIEDSPWPGFPADMTSVALVVATQCRGEVLIHEKLFESRLFFTDRLIEMGAKIVLCDPHRALIIGPSQLHGSRLSSPDIRAGMALLVAAMAAKGQSEIQNIVQIDRGYEKIDQRLKKLGACIERINSKPSG